MRPLPLDDAQLQQYANELDASVFRKTLAPPEEFMDEIGFLDVCVAPHPRSGVTMRSLWVASDAELDALAEYLELSDAQRERLGQLRLTLSLEGPAHPPVSLHLARVLEPETETETETD